ncbi:MAG: hypothetical protein AB2L14_06845 [Candidatus Xenobiia bacterium LiM19]
MMNHFVFGKVLSLILTLSLLSLYLLPLTGCGGSGSNGADGAGYSTGSAVAGTETQSSSTVSASSVKNNEGFTMGVLCAKSGGLGQAALSIDVSAGTRLLKIGPSYTAASGGSSGTLNGTTVTVSGPDNSVMATIKDGIADNSRLSSMPEPSAALEEGLEKASENNGTVSSGASTSDLQAALLSALDSDKDLQLTSVLRSELDNYIYTLGNTPNGGILNANSRDGNSSQIQSSQSGITIFNPTAGQWRIEITSTSQAAKFDLVAMAVPSTGLPSSEEIGQIVSTLQNTAGWQPESMFPETGTGLKADASYWLYDTIFWLVKSVCSPSVAPTLITYMIVIVYPPAYSKFSKIKSAVKSIMDSVANAVGVSNYESFTEKVAALVARALCSLFKQPYRTAGNMNDKELYASMWFTDLPLFCGRSFATAVI